MVNRRALPRCVLLVLLSTATTAFASTSYSVGVLSAPAGFSVVYDMTGINNAGQVGGYGYNGTTEQAFVSTTSGSAAVPLIPGWTNAVEFGINASGQVVGYGYNGTNDFAFIGTTSSSTAIFMTAGWASTTGNGINASGEVTGTRQVGSAYSGFVGTTSSATAIPVIAGWTSMGGYGINASGEVAGQGLNTLGNTQAFIYNGSTSSAIPLLPLFTSSFAEAINASGEVAGYTYNGTIDEAFIGTASGSTAIPLPAGATSASISGQSLNDSGVLVGGSDAGGWIWSSLDGTVLLSTLVPAGWDIEGAESISNNGLILAYASYNDGPGEYVELAPTPEPATDLLAGAGLIAAAFARRRKMNPRCMGRWSSPPVLLLLAEKKEHDCDTRGRATRGHPA